MIVSSVVVDALCPIFSGGVIDLDRLFVGVAVPSAFFVTATVCVPSVVGLLSGICTFARGDCFNCGGCFFDSEVPL